MNKVILVARVGFCKRNPTCSTTLGAEFFEQARREFANTVKVIVVPDPELEYPKIQLDRLNTDSVSSEVLFNLSQRAELIIKQLSNDTNR